MSARAPTLDPADADDFAAAASPPLRRRFAAGLLASGIRPCPLFGVFRAGRCRFRLRR